MKLILICEGDVALLNDALPDISETPADFLSFNHKGVDYAAYICLSPSPDYDWINLRQSWQLLGDDVWQAVSKAAEIFHFYNNHNFCNVCGSPLSTSSPISRKCPKCGNEVFAPMYPCIMVLVTDSQDRALLVRSKHFRHNFYGLVAGFVETGESLEECVLREVKEETSLEVEDIQYVESQSWPFPAQLMIGFIARLKAGHIDYDGDHIAGSDGELAKAAFFSRHNLPPIAPAPSLAHRLISRWANNDNLLQF